MAEAVIRLTERTREQCHAFFSTLEQDPALFARPEEFTPYVYDPEEVDARFDRQAARTDRRDYAVLLGDTVIGDLSIKNIDRQARRCELGLCLAGDRWKNRGYGTRAEQLAVALAFSELGMDTVTACCLPGNVRSRRALEKTGFRPVSREGDFILYEIKKPPQSEGDTCDSYPGT